MGTKAVPPQAEQTPQPLQTILKRVFSHTDGDTSSPTFVNAVEFSSMGMDVFMDAGVVSPESVTAALANAPAEGIPTVDLHVTVRFGMSLQTAMMMHQRLTDLLSHAQQQAAAMAQAGQTKTK